jgi:hypothetical protein
VGEREWKDGKAMRGAVRARACVRALCFSSARVPCIFKFASNNRLLCMCFGHESLTRGMGSPHIWSIAENKPREKCPTISEPYASAPSPNPMPLHRPLHDARGKFACVRTHACILAPE